MRFRRKTAAQQECTDRIHRKHPFGNIVNTLPAMQGHVSAPACLGQLESC
jgi:hypothetical protein